MTTEAVENLQPVPPLPPEVEGGGHGNPFRIPDFRKLLAVRVFAVLAVQIQSAAILWQVYAIARDRGASVPEAALYLSFVGLVQFVPLFLLVLPAGEMADRRDRKKIVAACEVAQACCGALFLALTLHGHPPMWSLLAVAALFGVGRAFLAPASQSMIPMLVPRSALPRAIVSSSLAFQLGAIAGPAVGGLIVGVSVAFAYGVSLILFLLAAITVMLVKGNTMPVRQPGSRIALMKEGLAYVWNTKIVFGAISLDLAAVLLGGATLLIPVFARDILHVGPEGFGAMRAGFGVGALLMAVYLMRWPIVKHGGRWMFAAVAVFGLATILFGVSKLLWLSVAALAIAGAADMISVNIRQTLIQIVTPDHMRGRVSSVSMLFIGASNELGEFESGLVARVLGPVGAAVFGGVGSLVATGLWAKWFPDLRKADRLT